MSNWIRKVVIMRGCQGSGKSTIAQQLKKDFKENKGAVPVRVCICSSDDYFLDENKNYNWTASKIGEAHDYCYNKFIESLKISNDESFFKGHHLIIIDNTNGALYEITPYVRLAKWYGYEVMINQVHVDPLVCTERCIHDVPANTVLAKDAEIRATIVPAFIAPTMTRIELTIKDKN